MCRFKGMFRAGFRAKREPHKASIALVIFDYKYSGLA
jgi:hypothetical protein